MKILGIAAFVGLVAGHFGGTYVGMGFFVGTICAIASFLEASKSFG
jgi:hypothetical protein